MTSYSIEIANKTVKFWLEPEKVVQQESVQVIAKTQPLFTESTTDADPFENMDFDLSLATQPGSEELTMSSL